MTFQGGLSSRGAAKTPVLTIFAHRSQDDLPSSFRIAQEPITQLQNKQEPCLWVQRVSRLGLNRLGQATSRCR